MTIKDQIEACYEKSDFTANDYELFNEFKGLLNTGQIRAAYYENGEWLVNHWVKKGILLGFRMGRIENVGDPEWGFTDKHTYGIRRFAPTDGVRLVPGGSAVRDAAFLARGVSVMPPSYINAGAYIDENSMIDSHALVGSCAFIGKNVHISAGTIIGGVLEPINANPVIVEDDVFIGGNCGLYEGVIVKTAAVVAAGVIITSGTPVFDAVNGCFLVRPEGQPLVIPQNAVVVAGARTHKTYSDISVYCPVIIKYRDNKTDKSVRLEQFLR